jgi:hypothetical protein
MDEGCTNSNLLAVLQMDSLHSELIAGRNTRIEIMLSTEKVVGNIPKMPAVASQQL